METLFAKAASLAAQPWSWWRPAAPFHRAAETRRRAALLVALLCLAQVLLWGIAFSLTYKAPEIDSAEQFVWSFSLENGYWKHPPMPTWIMHGLILLFGPSLALPVVAAQVSVVVALALMWWLGCAFMSPRRSLIALVLTSLITYHNLGGDNYNHNTALLPFQAATVLMFYRATRQGHWHQWALAGLFGGFAMLVKYVALIPIVGLLLYVLLDRGQHRVRTLLGVALAAAMVAAVTLPHALWLRDSDFLPFRYARSVAQASPGLAATLDNVGGFLALQLVRLLPFVLALGALLWWSRRDGATAPARPAIERGDRLFLWVAALAPLAGTLLISLVSQTQLQGRWGSNVFLLTGWLAVALLPRLDSPRTLRRAVGLAAAVQLVLCLGMTLTKTVVAERMHVRTRANFPGALLAENARVTWARYSSIPLHVVVSDIWLGGNIVANAGQRVAVLIDGHTFKSPWVKESTIAECGALVIDDLSPDAAGRSEPNPALDALMARASATGTWSLRWANTFEKGRGGSSGHLKWGVILPTRPHACRL